MDSKRTPSLGYKSFRESFDKLLQTGSRWRDVSLDELRSGSSIQGRTFKSKKAFGVCGNELVALYAKFVVIFLLELHRAAVSSILAISCREPLWSILHVITCAHCFASRVSCSTFIAVVKFLHDNTGEQFSESRGSRTSR